MDDEKKKKWMGIRKIVFYLRDLDEFMTRTVYTDCPCPSVMFLPSLVSPPSAFSFQYGSSLLTNIIIIIVDVYAGKGWVGWKNDTRNSSSPVEIIFKFDSVREFNAVHIHASNQFLKDVQVICPYNTLPNTNSLCPSS